MGFFFPTQTWSSEPTSRLQKWKPRWSSPSACENQFFQADHLRGPLAKILLFSQADLLSGPSGKFDFCKRTLSGPPVKIMAKKNLSLILILSTTHFPPPPLSLNLRHLIHSRNPPLPAPLLPASAASSLLAAGSILDAQPWRRHWRPRRRRQPRRLGCRRLPSSIRDDDGANYRDDPGARIRRLLLSSQPPTMATLLDDDDDREAVDPPPAPLLDVRRRQWPRHPSATGSPPRRATTTAPMVATTMMTVMPRASGSAVGSLRACGSAAGWSSRGEGRRRRQGGEVAARLIPLLAMTDSADDDCRDHEETEMNVSVSIDVGGRGGGSNWFQYFYVLDLSLLLVIYMF